MGLYGRAIEVFMDCAEKRKNKEKKTFHKNFSAKRCTRAQIKRNKENNGIPVQKFMPSKSLKIGTLEFSTIMLCQRANDHFINQRGPI